MADQELQLRVGKDAEHQNRSQAPLRALIEQRRAQQLHNPLGRWPQLESIEGLDEDTAAGQPGWAGMVQDGAGWREG